MPLFNLSVEAGRFYDVISGKWYAVNGGRSNPTLSDRLKGFLLFTVEILRPFAKNKAPQPISFVDEVPCPDDSEGVDLNASDWGGYGKSCKRFDTCGY